MATCSASYSAESIHKGFEIGRVEEMSICTTTSPASVGFAEFESGDVDDIDAPPEPASVTCELFVLIGSGLHLREIAASAATSRALAACVREELARRDVASHRLHAWSNHTDWHLAFRNVCGLDQKQRQWKSLPPMLEGRVGAVCAMIGNFIYVIGGCRHGRPTNAFERLSLDRGTWEALPPLLGRRRVDADTSVAVLQGHLYVCGGTGFDGLSPSSCVDRFDPEECYWEVLEPMPVKRRGAAAVVLSERLYICGGMGPEGSGEVLCFDPVKVIWELLPPMLDEHYRAQAVVANGTIYVGQRFCPPPLSAGSSRYHQSETMSSLTQGERFQATTRSWSRCMGTLFSSPGSSVALVMSSCLYLCEAPCNGRSMSERCLHVAGTERYESTTSTAGAGGSRRRVLGRNHTA